MNDIFEGIVKSIYWIFWEIVGAISYFLDSIIDFFKVFSGIDEAGTIDVLRIFKEPIFWDAYIWIVGISASLLFVFAIIKIVREDYFSKEGPSSKGPILRNMGISFFLFILITPALFLVTNFLSYIIMAIPLLLNGDGEFVSLARVLFDGSFGEGMNSVLGIGEEMVAPWKDIGFDTFYEKTYTNVNLGLEDSVEFYWYIFLIAGVYIAKNLIIILVELIKRIFSIVFLYLLAPFEIANFVSDEGARFKRWKDRMVNQIVSFLAIIISFFVFLAIIDIISVSIGEMESIYLIILLMGGSLLLKDTSSIVSKITNADSMFTNTIKETYKETNKVINNVTTGNSKSSSNSSSSFSDNYTKKSGNTGSSRSKVFRTTPRRVSSTTNVRKDFSIGALAGKNNFSNRRSSDDVMPYVSREETKRSVNKISARIDSTSSSVGVSSLKANMSTSKTKGFDKRRTTSPTIKSNSFRSTGIEIAPPNLGSNSENSFEQKHREASSEFDNNLKNRSVDNTALKKSGLNYANNIEAEVKNYKQEFEKNSKVRADIKKNLEPKELSKANQIEKDRKKAQFDVEKTTTYIKKEISGSNVNNEKVAKFKQRAEQQRETLKQVSKKANDFYSRKGSSGGKK